MSATTKTSREHVMVVYLADGAKVTTFPTKKAAKAAGLEARAAGVDAFVFSTSDWAKVSK